MKFEALLDNLARQIEFEIYQMVRVAVVLLVSYLMKEMTVDVLLCFKAIRIKSKNLPY